MGQGIVGRYQEVIAECLMSIQFWLSSDHDLHGHELFFKNLESCKAQDKSHLSQKRDLSSNDNCSGLTGQLLGMLHQHNNHQTPIFWGYMVK